MITKNFLYVFVAYVVSNFSGYVFHALVSRILGPSLYGDFCILYAFMLVFSRPIGAISTAVTRTIMLEQEQGISFGNVFKSVLRFATIIAFIFGVVPIIGVPVFRKLMGIYDIFLYCIAGFVIFLWTFLGIFRGILASKEDFKTISLSAIIEFATRAVVGTLLVVFGFKVYGALMSSVIGAITGTILCMIRVRSLECLYKINRSLKILKTQGSFFKTTLKITFITVPSGLFLELDLLLSKKYFSSHEAGLYAGGALFGKAFLSCSTIISSVLYPKLVSSNTSKKRLLYFSRGMLFSVCVFCIAYLLVNIAGNTLVRFVFGDKFAEIGNWISLYVVAMFFLSINFQIMNVYNAAGGIKEGLWLWGMLILYYIVLNNNTESFLSYIRAVLLFNAFMGLLGLIICKPYITNKVVL